MSSELQKLYSMEMHRTFDELVERNGGYENIGICMNGIKDKYPLCCIFFFMSVWRYVRKNIDEYRLFVLSNDSDRILCPECIIKGIKK